MNVIAILVTLMAQNHGDAPAPYPTVTHTNTSFEHLGAAVGNDAANPVTPPWTGSADDDGFTVANLAKGATATLTVDVQNLWAADDLAVWADWNADGVWDPVTERILWAGVSAAAPNGPIVNGPNNFDVAVPSTAAGTVARIRVRLWDTSAFGAMPNGGADGGGDPSGDTTWGEVEDYELTYAVVNAAPTAVIPGGSAFTGNAAAGFDLSATVGVPLTGADLQLTDPDADPVNLNNVTGSAPGVTAPLTGVYTGAVISWTGTPTTPGLFTYTLDIDDGVNPNVVFDVRLNVAAAVVPGGGTSGGSTTTPATPATPAQNNKSGKGPGGLFHCSASGSTGSVGFGGLALAVVALFLAHRRRRSAFADRTLG